MILNESGTFPCCGGYGEHFDWCPTPRDLTWHRDEAEAREVDEELICRTLAAMLWRYATTRVSA